MRATDSDVCTYGSRRTEQHKSHQVGRRSTVAAGDGTALAVREFGHPNAPLTAVFVHGHCLRMQSWTDLREQVEHAWGNDVRIVMYDHRGHGESSAAAPESCTIDQLGEDLADVIRAMVPSGPFVVVGHSMGGMTALSYARQNPEAIGTRLVGVGLIATSAGGITDDGLGSALAHPAVSVFQAAVRRAPRLMSGAKRLSRGVWAPIVRTASTLQGTPSASGSSSALAIASRVRHACTTNRRVRLI